VSPQYIAMAICPEDAPARLPGLGFPTAMAHGNTTYPFYTDASGNGMMMFFPYALHCPIGGSRAISAAATFARVVNGAYVLFVPPEGSASMAGGAAFDPITGSYFQLDP